MSKPVDKFPFPQIPEHVRAYVYAVFVASLPLLVAASLIAGPTVPAIVLFVEAVLGLGMAAANTDFEKQG